MTKQTAWYGRHSSWQTTITYTLSHRWCEAEISHIEHPYSRVHKHLSYKDPVRANETNDIDDSISMYMTFYRAWFPDVRIVPKQHILEAHCMQWIGCWGFGLALHGEQGGEEIHATVNRIQRRAWGMRNDEDRLHLLMKEQLTHASPVFQTHYSQVNNMMLFWQEEEVWKTIQRIPIMKMGL